MIGRHKCKKSKSDPTYSERWSGVSYAPHSEHFCQECGEQLHDEGGKYYCPGCDDYKFVRRSL